ncbi:hypothetical protein ACLF6K_36095 [Streptomyces xanthophaeus]|uniref:hypothetical protein n=1 Tax=Streptomyces xanthophaeus TaxID=67385 RepID=UPI00398FD7E0
MPPFRSTRAPELANSSAVASAWAEVLVRRDHLHAALPTPNGQWLVQEGPKSPVLVLSGAEDLLGLAARAQRLDRITRNSSR